MEHQSTNAPWVERRKLLYRPEEAADALGIKRTLLYSLMSSGRISYRKLGRVRLIPASALEEFIGTLEHEVTYASAAQ